MRAVGEDHGHSGDQEGEGGVKRRGAGWGRGLVGEQVIHIFLCYFVGSSHPQMTRESTRANRQSTRERRKALDMENMSKKRRKVLKSRISKRLSEVPSGWRSVYHEKLVKVGIDPRTDIKNVNSLKMLEIRARLLPPGPVYRQHVGNSPSRPEPRAFTCKSMEGHTKDYVASKCNNTHIIRDPLLSAKGSPVRRFSPKNVRKIDFADGGSVCIHPQYVKTLNKSGYMIDAAYQKDANTDEWPEVMVDVPGNSGTGGEVLQTRIPYHVMERCGVRLSPQPVDNRKEHPTHPENARGGQRARRSRR